MYPSNIPQITYDNEFENLFRKLKTVFSTGIAYDRESEFLKIVRSDKELAIKLWDFLVYSTATVLNRIIEKKNSLLSRPVAKTYRFLKTNEDAIRLAFCAISNFVGADIDVIPVTKYAEMIIVLGPIWKEGSFDEFGRLSYFPLENLVWKVERAEHFLDVGLLSMPDLIARCRSYPFNSTQFAGLLAIILNLCQVQRANKLVIFCTNLFLNCQFDEFYKSTT